MQLQYNKRLVKTWLWGNDLETWKEEMKNLTNEMLSFSLRRNDVLSSWWSSMLLNCLCCSPCTLVVFQSWVVLFAVFHLLLRCSSWMFSFDLLLPAPYSCSWSFLFFIFFVHFVWMCSLPLLLSHVCFSCILQERLQVSIMKLHLPRSKRSMRFASRFASSSQPFLPS